MSHTASLVWITPDAEELLVRIARVSNPDGDRKPAPHLIRYRIEHRHFSPFEMVNLCIEVETTRDMGRQMLRHWTRRPPESCVSGDTGSTEDMASGVSKAVNKVEDYHR